MTDRLCIVLAQLNPSVGGIDENMERIRAARAEAADADLIVFPELVISGYPPEDMVLRPSYAAACRAAVSELAKETASGPAIIIGSPWPDAQSHDKRPFNATVLCADGKIIAAARKRELPNYGVFDEPRTFQSAESVTPPIDFKGVKIGLMTCEDMWYPDTADELKEQGAELLIAPHGSPFRRTCHGERLFQAEARVRETGLPLIFVNQVGGQDELVFDGGAFVMQTDETTRCAPLFEEGLYPTLWEKEVGGLVCIDGPSAEWPEEEALTYPALVLGTRDYIRKSGFERVVIGLSGGIDSALVAAIATDALGPENVRCVMMPSRYTSDHSLEDAKACAEALGVRYNIVPIEEAVTALTSMLDPLFGDLPPDETEENLQSRIRGTTLMAITNKFGSLMLSTGNKSEMAVGYATLYGDMNGAYNPIKDVYKTKVFSLARWRNENLVAQGLGPAGMVIPERIITKPPSAELREDQKDEDSLPPYEVLDDILHGLIEEELSFPQIISRGHDAATVQRVQGLLYRAEFKRRQAPPGPKVTSKNFGRDRRYPILNRWRDPIE
ncbi:NAD+ synthase [Parvularcula marina]|uniref:Glutamine-dependent NAD(+) synthetase n=1 Tax=Parvularcula marina TaxID=2292771 RepID=A0A371RKM7_9PROT|nr:NAD+ synthase [Parvularcula marina]RFB06015.1 NAD+ synthase [Parvularcula marina]